jgi:hypothetical protein
MLSGDGTGLLTRMFGLETMGTMSMTSESAATVVSSAFGAVVRWGMMSHNVDKVHRISSR